MTLPSRDPGLKFCNGCRRWRAIGQFERNGAKGRRGRCKECRAPDWAANAARRRGAGVRPVSKADIDRLWTQQRGTCNVCPRSLLYGYHVDHIVPVSKGGQHELANLQLLCPEHNLRKGNR